MTALIQHRVGSVTAAKSLQEKITPDTYSILRKLTSSHPYSYFDTATIATRPFCNFIGASPPSRYLLLEKQRSVATGIIGTFVGVGEIEGILTSRLLKHSAIAPLEVERKSSVIRHVH